MNTEPAEGKQMNIPINFLLWAYLISLSIHIVEESTVGGGFIEMMKKNFWPEYTARKFFGFNMMIYIFFASGLILFEAFGGAWVVWPLSFAFMCVTNGIWHILQTCILREYSPGLITAPIYWILMYFIIRYSLQAGEILLHHFTIAAAIGTTMTLLMFGSVWSFRSRAMSAGEYQARKNPNDR